MKHNLLHTWMGIATSAQQQALADEVCGGSRAYLYQLANGRREPSPLAAARMETFTKKLNRESNGALPVVWRVDMVAACGACEFAKKCMAQQRSQS